MTTIIFAAQEIEAWMDQALWVVDDGLTNLFALIANLHERTQSVTTELRTLESFRRLFTSLNFFVVPVVVAILLCYGTREPVASGSHGIEVGFQLVVMFLMFLSSSVGFPFYAVSLWESYRLSKEKLPDCSLNREPRDFPYDESLLAFLNHESPRERLNEFARMLNQRMPDRMREHIQRIREQATSPRAEESSEVEMESALTGSTHPPESAGETQEPDTNEFQVEAGAEFPILYQFQVLMNQKSPDVAVRIAAAPGATSEEDALLFSEDAPRELNC
ncbi:uncharacterized protein CDAR_567451 [Caerostris darwini]|uniref:Uncharacterized protein n=1 Tax=Caerostris darwini TaxID=1538125 RepID=A0AAV4QVE7_9ARAC|nr:uncharacterized protein CDAR_567451 [Caerostris darwini]